nr:hypothetical protein [uncultured Campylobacter sp.]
MSVVRLSVAYVQLAWTQCGCTEPGATIEILEFEARGTLNLIARKRHERVKFIMPILYEIS